MKYGTEVTFKISSNLVGDSKDKNPHKLLLINIQVSKFRKPFANNSSDNIKLSKTQLHKIEQSRGFLDRLLVTSLKTGLSLMKNALKLLAQKSIWINSSSISNRCSYS